MSELFVNARPRAIATALLGAYAFRTASAALLAWPLLHTTAASGLLDLPAADALLFEPGGMYLVELLQQERRAWLELLPWYVLGWMGLAFLGLGPQWLLFRACAPERHDRPEAMRQITAFALLGCLCWLTRAALLVATAAAALMVHHWLDGSPDERQADLGALGVIGLGLLAQAGLSVAHDASRAALVRSASGVFEALALGLASWKRHASKLCGWYIVTGLGALLCATGGAALGSIVGNAWPGAFGLAVRAVAQQAAVLAALGARALWVAVAVRAIAPAESARAAQAEAFL